MLEKKKEKEKENSIFSGQYWRDAHTNYPLALNFRNDEYEILITITNIGVISIHLIYFSKYSFENAFYDVVSMGSHPLNYQRVYTWSWSKTTSKDCRDEQNTCNHCVLQPARKIITEFAKKKKKKKKNQQINK